MKIDLFLSRFDIQQEKVKGRIAIIIDVLRASTSIITALASGSQGVIPLSEVEEARKLAQKFSSQSVLLGGERNEMPIPGFNLSNSPFDYTVDRVENKRIIFTSTNGARLFDHARQAEVCVVGAFVNVTSLCNYILKTGLDIAILCAGKKGSFGLEDVVCGGLIVDKISAASPDTLHLNDGAVASQILYNFYADNIYDMLVQSSHGKRLIEIGQEKDLKRCASIDSIQAIPFLKGDELISLKNNNLEL